MNRPQTYSQLAASTFNQIVASVEPYHFRKSDVHPLASFAQAISLARFYARLIGEDPGAFKAWTEAIKLQNNFSTKLRLYPVEPCSPRSSERSTRTHDVDPPCALCAERTMGISLTIPVCRKASGASCATSPRYERPTGADHDREGHARAIEEAFG